MRNLNPSASADSRQLIHIDLYNSLVLEIKRYLRNEGLNQTQLAERLGVSKGYVSRLLNGNGDPKLSSILDLALAIGKEPVLGFTDRPLPKPWDQPDESFSGMIVNDADSSYGQTKAEDTSSFEDKIDWNALQALPIIEKVTAIHERIENMRPFSRNMENHVVQQLIRTWNYNSNAIEGNSLTYGETIQLLLHGLTAKGKPLKDHLDVIGHQEAVGLMLAMVKERAPLRQTDIRQLHKVLLKEDYQQKAETASGREIHRTIRVGVYKREPNHVVTKSGDKHYYAEPNAVPGLMAQLIDWYNGAEQRGDIHPLVRAAVLHHEFVAIHPFDDGNGRMTRILMNLSLMRSGYPLSIVPVDDRLDYYACLRAADKKNFVPLVEFLGSRLYTSLDIILTTARGEDIGGSKWDTIDDDPR